MITIPTPKKYKVYEVFDDGAESLCRIGWSYTPLDVVNSLINSPLWCFENERHNFIVEMDGKRSKIFAHKGWVVDFSPYSEQKGVCLNDYTEA